MPELELAKLLERVNELEKRMRELEQWVDAPSHDDEPHDVSDCIERGCIPGAWAE